ncbi:CoA-transferase family III domain-containing protein [Mycena crocata]|nr:CoA-transferase family III domain-containing protein [Mycena crocata]
MLQATKTLNPRSALFRSGQFTLARVRTYTSAEVKTHASASGSVKKFGGRQPFSTSPARLNDNDAESDSTRNALPLAGIRVLELGQLIAGPFAGQLLGQFGAEIIKVEAPKKGDALRVWRELDVDGCSPWFRSIGRNKKSVAIDLHTVQGRELVRKLALRSDVLIENFKSGTLEKWSLDPASLHPHNPDLIYTRVSGYGQTGPWAPRPGYASVCEAESGFRFINGFPASEFPGEDGSGGGLSGPPVRPNISLGDSVAGLHAAFGTVLALLQRQKKRARGEAGGTTVDVSILESMLNLMEGIIPEYDRMGKVRGPSGSSVTGIVPTNAYPCLPSPAAPSTPVFIVIGANGDAIYGRLMALIGAPHLATPEYEQNHNRVAHRAEIEEAISAWTRARSAEEVEERMRGAGVPVGRVVSVREIVGGEQMRARGAVQDVWVPGPGARRALENANADASKSDGTTSSSKATAEDAGEAEGWHVKMPGTFPVLDGIDPKPRWAGPDLGAHTEEVLVGDFGLSKEEMGRLRAEGVVA